jgi:hypothetical protein
MLDNVQKVNNCIPVQSSQTLSFHLQTEQFTKCVFKLSLKLSYDGVTHCLNLLLSLGGGDFVYKTTLLKQLWKCVLILSSDKQDMRIHHV